MPLLPTLLFAYMNLIGPALGGYVTSVEPNTLIVSGYRVDFTTATKLLVMKDGKTTPIDHLPTPYLGEAVTVWGSADRKTHTAKATTIQVYDQSTPLPTVGSGLILGLKRNPEFPGTIDLWAAGFKIHLTPQTKVDPTSKIPSLEALAPGQWIAFHGLQPGGGIVAADKIAAFSNTLDPAEIKYRDMEEFTPGPAGSKAAYDIQALKSAADHLTLHDDPDLQARVQRIGQSLIPAWALTDPAPTHINFRFYVVDDPKLTLPTNLVNGIILIPFTSLARLLSDDQIAAILADEIAATFEGQEMTTDIKYFTNRRGSATAALAAAAFFAGGVGVVIVATNIDTFVPRGLSESQALHCRNSLYLLSQAGYDLTQAPIAWWLITPKKSEPIAQTPIPYRATELYEALGTTWKDHLN